MRTITVAGAIISLLNFWCNPLSAQHRPSTASSSVTPLSETLYMGAGQRQVTIRIYRAATVANKALPVLYMMDGQNLFDDSTSYVGEWGVDEILDSMAAPLMVVGIDHAGQARIREYGIIAFKDYGSSYSQAFISWLADTLKPFIDRHYTTLTGPSTTWIAGSSLGGLISTLAVTLRPEVFGGAGIFSPSYEYLPKPDSIFSWPDGKQLPVALWLYAGGRESEKMVPCMLGMAAYMSKGASLTEVHTDAQQGHNERAWRKWFPQFINFMQVSIPQLDAPEK